MKKLYITLLLFLTLSVTAQIDLGAIVPYTVCDNNTDGYADFLLQTHVPEVLGDLSSANYSVTFYLSQADAVAATNALPNLFTNTIPYQQTLFVRVVENANTSNTGIAPVDLIVGTAPVVNTPAPYAVCDINGDGIAIFDLSTQIDEITGGANTLEVTFHDSYYDAVNQVNGLPENTLTSYQIIDPYTQTIYANVKDMSVLFGCSTIVSITLQVAPSPQVNPLPFIYGCGGVYNLTDNDHQIDPDFTRTFHATAEDAQNNINPIANTTAYTGNANHEIWYRITNDATICPLITSTYLSDEAIDIADAQICADYTTDDIVSDYTFDTYLDPAIYTFTWTKDGTLIAGETSPSLTANQVGFYTVTASRQDTNCITVSNTFHLGKSSPASPIGSGITINGQNATVNVEGFGVYRYILDGGDQHASNVFYNLSLGQHTMEVFDTGGCGSLSINFVILVPNAPTGEINQDFTEGETLADLEVTGENIVWYATDGQTPPPSALEETPLPLTTVLIDGTTYYATQTIDDTESTDRLAVTVHSVLSTDKNTIAGFSLYPNPVKDVVKLSAQQPLGQVTLYTIVGQPVFSKNFTDTAATIDMAPFAKGIYLLKIQSANGQKTVKIIKE